MLLILQLFLLLLVFEHGSTKCVTQGMCHSDPDSDVKIPCGDERGTIYNTLRLNRTLAGLKKFNYHCQHLFEDGNEDVCCNQEQADILINQLTNAEAAFGRCPSCMDNFAKLWCEFTCSPRQSEFVKVLESSVVNNISYIDRAEYRIDKNFIQGTFDSCKDVIFQGGLAIRVMSVSTPYNVANWLKFIGTRNFPNKIPINTNFKLIDPVNATETYTNISFSKCSQSARPGFLPCAVMECEREKMKETIILDDGNQPTGFCNVRGTSCIDLMLVFILGCICFILLSTFVFARNTEARNEGRESRVARTGEWIQRNLESSAQNIGELAARNPSNFFFVGTLFVIFSVTGMVYNREVNDIHDMWSSPHSKARLERESFFDTFGKTQRFSQLMIKSNRESAWGRLPGPIWGQDIMREAFEILYTIQNLTGDRNITLDHVCSRPMGPNSDCLILSPTNYLQNDVNKTYLLPEQSWLTGDYYDSEDDLLWNYHVAECIEKPLTLKTMTGLSCFGTYGGPVDPNIALGRKPSKKDFKDANAFMMIFPLTQSNAADSIRAEIWEKEFLKFCKNYIPTSKNISTSCHSDISIRDEIDHDSSAEVMTIVIALLFILGYVSFSLGRYFVCEDKLWSILVHSRICIGLWSIIVNIISCFCTWGVFSFLSIHPIKTALIVHFFVVTFLGVNRTFMVVKTYAQYRVSENYRSSEHISEIISKVMVQTLSPMLTSSFACSFAFLVASFSDLPAIRIFCLYTGLAIIIDVFLHCTLFLSCFVWDTKRELDGKPEFIFLFNFKLEDLYGAYLVGRQNSTDTYLSQHFKKHIAPFMVKFYTRIGILTVFVISFIITLVLSFFCSIGFDQSHALSESSYVTQHFRNVDNYMNIGPPVYFTAYGELDWHTPRVQNMFCSLPGCDRSSFGTILQYAVTEPEETYLSGQVFNWIDSYLQWISRESSCCKVYVDDPNTFCSSSHSASNDPKMCRSCMDYDFVANSKKKGSIEYERPSQHIFYKHLRHFLDDVPTSACVHGGRASYKEALSITPRGRIQASHFMTFHKKLLISNSTDFIVALERSRMISRRLQKSINNEATVFAYSEHYSFFEQYLTITLQISTLLLITLIGIMTVVAVMSGIDFIGAAWLTVCQVSNYVHIMALMYLFNIPINALSITILIMSFGILIEFSVNMLKAFARSTQKTTCARAEEAVGIVGPIILSGPITSMTGSTCFLAGAHLLVIYVYFFQLVFIAIVSSALHSLVYLPILLTLRENVSRVDSPSLINCSPNNGKLKTVSIETSKITQENLEEQELLLSSDVKLDTLALQESPRNDPQV